MFARLKNLFSPKVTKEEEQHTGLALIQKFSTDDEPKVVDYPKGKYTAFWEILINDIAGGYTAHVRFYDYAGSSLLKETQFIAPTVPKLKSAVNEHIRSEMKQYAR